MRELGAGPVCVYTWKNVSQVSVKCDNDESMPPIRLRLPSKMQQLIFLLPGNTFVIGSQEFTEVSRNSFSSLQI